MISERGLRSNKSGDNDCRDRLITGNFRFLNYDKWAELEGNILYLNYVVWQVWRINVSYL